MANFFGFFERPAELSLQRHREKWGCEWLIEEGAWLAPPGVKFPDKIQKAGRRVGFFPESGGVFVGLRHGRINMDGSQDLVQAEALLHRQHVFGDQIAGVHQKSRCVRIGTVEEMAPAIVTAPVYDANYELAGAVAVVVGPCDRDMESSVLAMLEGVVGYLTLVASEPSAAAPSGLDSPRRGRRWSGLAHG